MFLKLTTKHDAQTYVRSDLISAITQDYPTGLTCVHIQHDSALFLVKETPARVEQMVRAAHIATEHAAQSEPMRPTAGVYGRPGTCFKGAPVDDHGLPEGATLLGF